MNFPETLRGARIGLIGLGRSNTALAAVLVREGASVFVTESRPEREVADQLRRLPDGVSWECGGHTDEVLASDAVVRSPGVPLHAGIMRAVQSRSIPCTNELEVSYRILSARGVRPRIIAVTGTNGKTTTVSLIGEIMRSWRTDTIVAGNIGSPLAEHIDRIGVDTPVVLEVSSYQLEDVETFHPQVSCLLNIGDDHREHHGSVEEYIRCKMRMFMNQTSMDVAILNDDDVCLRGVSLPEDGPRRYGFSLFRPPASGAWRDSEGVFRLSGGGLHLALRPQLHIPGSHNVSNALAAALAASLSGVPGPMIERAISMFHGVEHRIEFVREIDGVRYYNDSKGTNVDSTVIALRSMDRPVHLILGGRDKGAPYDPLLPLIRARVRTVLLIGEATPIIRAAVQGAGVPVHDAGVLEQAVALARAFAKPGEAVLLSPACASFDQFENYEHRGREFKRLVGAFR